MSELRFKKDHSFDGWPTKDTLTGMHLNLDSSRDTLNCQDSVINKLKSDNKLLMDALSLVVNNNDSSLIFDWAICGICTNSSSGSEGRDSRMKTYHDFHLAWCKAKLVFESATKVLPC